MPQQFQTFDEWLATLNAPYDDEDLEKAYELGVSHGKAAGVQVALNIISDLTEQFFEVNDNDEEDRL